MSSGDASGSAGNARNSARDASGTSRDDRGDGSSLDSGVAAGGGGPTRVRAWATAAEIEAWLLQRLQARLGAGAETTGETVDRHMPFSYYGLDSIDAVELAAELEDWLGRPVSATLTFDYPTVSAVASYLAAESVFVPPTDAAAVQALLSELEGKQPTDR